MLNHLRANLLLVAATLGLCSVAYPLTLWAIGQTVFHDQAEGSLIRDKDGTVIGSRLIGQPFAGKEYFQPRPSAAGNGYDASASGATNWAASNPLLRDRVARQLGPLVKYAADSATKPGQPVGPDVEAWFARQPADYALTWAREHPKLAEQWVKDNTAGVAAYVKKDEKEIKDNAADNVVPFFEAFVKDNKNAWPTTADKKVGDETVKVIEPVQAGDAVQAYFFDLWLSDNRAAKLEKVPADLVMASGSGLDPHITWANARYQEDGIVDEWVKKTGASTDAVRKVVDGALSRKVFSPFNRLFGQPMVNVLEVNLEIRDGMQPLLDRKSK